MKKQQKKQLKQVQNQAQEGRSMVEMLGVLAIIGVISIGGIAGYRMAMNRYQANQIANEINLMRTDAKMKVARGVELLLGEPYDGEEGHLKFNESYAVEIAYPVIISDEEGGEEGYSFTLSGIPAGVCKPLATLLDSMDDTAALEINGGDYTTTENLCSETENEVMVAFSTKDIGGVSGGSDNPEPPEEQGDEPQDDDPVPEECPKGTTRSDDGNECTCAEDEKTCNGGCCAGCSGGKVWTGKKCACPAGAELSEDGEKCVCSTATPYWDGTKCTTCPEGSKPENGKCVCSSDTSKEWKASLENGGCDKERVGECEKNSDCGLGEYCYMYYGKDCGDDQEFDPNKFGGYNTRKSECRNASKDIKDGKAGAKSGFIFGEPSVNNGYMTWWSAGRFCEALGMKQATRASIGCGEVSSGGICQIRKDLYDDFGNCWVWMYDMYDSSCNAYRVNLMGGIVDKYGRNRNGNYALCE